MACYLLSCMFCFQLHGSRLNACHMSAAVHVALSELQFAQCSRDNLSREHWANCSSDMWTAADMWHAWDNMRYYWPNTQTSRVNVQCICQKAKVCTLSSTYRYVIAWLAVKFEQKQIRSVAYWKSRNFEVLITKIASCIILHPNFSNLRQRVTTYANQYVPYDEEFVVEIIFWTES